MPRFALNLGIGGRIESVTYEKYASPGQPIVDELPEGNVYAYDYINGAFVLNDARAAALAAEEARDRE